MKKNISHKKWFTLIELIIVIAIMTMLLLAAYVPFDHYKSKQLVKNSAKLISQVLNDSRNSAIYWIASFTWNLDIGVLLLNGGDKIWIYWFPFNETISNYTSPDNKYHLEDINLEKWVKITSSWWLFLYKAITWSWIYKWNIVNNITDNKIKISVWLWWVKTWIMKNNIEYYTKTYISDITK